MAWMLLPAGLAGLPGCGGLGGLMSPRTLSIDAVELQRILDRSFPVERRLLEVLDVRVWAPRLRLLPAVNRLGMQLEVGARDRLFGGSWGGRLDFDAGLRFDSTDASLRLAQVRVLDFSLDATGSAARSPAERLGATLVERVLEGFSVYRLPAERAESLRRAGLAPVALTVSAGGVEIALAPVVPAAPATR